MKPSRPLVSGLHPGSSPSPTEQQGERSAWWNVSWYSFEPATGGVKVGHDAEENELGIKFSQLQPTGRRCQTWV